MMVDEKLLQKCNELLNYLHEKYSVRTHLNLDLHKEHNPALSSEEWRHLIATIVGLGEFLDYVGVSRGERDEEGNQ